MARAEATGEPLEEAARAEGVAPSTAYLARERLDAGAPAIPPATPSLPASPIDAEQLEAVRRLVAAGDYTARGPAQLAATLGLGPEAVRELLQQVAALEAADRLPPELARAESIAFGRKARQAAREAGDIKGALAAQQHLDRLYGVDPRLGGRGDVIAREEVVGLLRRVAVALVPWPEAVAAFRGVVQSESGGSAA